MAKQILSKVFWGLFAVFIGLHLYALSLKFIPLGGTILMVQRQAQGETIKRDWTPIEDISPYIVQAVIGGEDSRFCEHSGIDWDAIEQAMEDNAEGGKRRGGSTITQQTAKNVFFWNGGGYIRKAGEAWFALVIDFTWGKQRVMEVYLNVAEWGDGIFGIEAAAQERFGKPANKLTAQEAALLAAVLPSPNKWRVDPPGSYVRGRAGTLRQRMRVVNDSGYDACVLGGTSASYPKAPPPKAAPTPAKPEPKAPTTFPKETEAVEPETTMPDKADETETDEAETNEIELDSPKSVAEPEPDPIVEALPDLALEPAPESEVENAVIDLGAPESPVPEIPKPTEKTNPDISASDAAILEPESKAKFEPKPEPEPKERPE